jgi:hypothetical protein
MAGQGQRVLKIRHNFSKISNYGESYTHRSLTTLFAIPEVLTAVLERILVFWDVTLCYLVNVPDVSKGSSVFIFNGHVVQEERYMTLEYEAIAFF